MRKNNKIKKQNKISGLIKCDYSFRGLRYDQRNGTVLGRSAPSLTNGL